MAKSTKMLNSKEVQTAMGVFTILFALNIHNLCKVLDLLLILLYYSLL